MKKIVLSIFVCTLLCLIAQVATTYSSSSPPTGNTNGPAESNCTGCHGGSLQTSGTLFNNISLTSTVALSSFQANTAYTMTLTFSDPGSTKYGFQLLALPSGGGSTANSLGTFSNLNSTTAISSTGPRSYMSHSSTGTAASGNTRTWTFTWTTPTSFTGGVSFYVIINSSNGDNGTGGDAIIARVFSGTVLPVEWMNVKGTRLDNEVQLNWITASESNNDRFEIESSADTKEWSYVGTIKGKGNSNIATHYTFKVYDNLEHYYRIKQIDYDGKFDYSPIISLKKTDEPLSLKYDIAKQKIFIEHANLQEGFVIYSLQGLPVMKGEIKSEINVSSLSKGLYLFQTSHNQIAKLLIN